MLALLSPPPTVSGSSSSYTVNLSGCCTCSGTVDVLARPVRLAGRPGRCLSEDLRLLDPCKQGAEGISQGQTESHSTFKHAITSDGLATSTVVTLS